MTKGMRGAFAVGMAISSLGLTAAANAAVTNIYTLNQDGCSSKCSPNSQDNVSVVDDGSGTLDVTLTLFGGDSIHNNPDANHHALVFDLADAPAIIISGLPSPFTANGDQIAASYKDPSFDSFEYDINWPKVRGSKPTITTFSFDMTGVGGGLTLSDIIGNGGIYFATDIIGANGNTGNVGANSFTTTGAVPEPSTWAMLLLGFAGLGYAAYRKTKTERMAFA
jgi:hypothetical protein